MASKDLLDLIVEYGNTCYDCGAHREAEKETSIREYNKLMKISEKKIDEITGYITQIINSLKGE